MAVVQASVAMSSPFVNARYETRQPPRRLPAVSCRLAILSHILREGQLLSVVKWFGPTERREFRPRLDGLEA